VDHRQHHRPDRRGQWPEPGRARLIAHSIDAFAAGRLVTGTLSRSSLRSPPASSCSRTCRISPRRWHPSAWLATCAPASSPNATQDVAYIQRTTTATLLTNLTSDIDAVKLFVSQAVGSIVVGCPHHWRLHPAAVHQLAAPGSRSWLSFRSSASPSGS
jgi:hypothetical protein